PTFSFTIPFTTTSSWPRLGWHNVGFRSAICNCCCVTVVNAFIELSMRGSPTFASGVAGQKRAVRRYWEEHPCGADGIEAECYSAEYFQGIEQRRRKFEPIIDSFADFRAY